MDSDDYGDDEEDSDSDSRSNDENNNNNKQTVNVANVDTPKCNQATKAGKAKKNKTSKNTMKKNKLGETDKLGNAHKRTCLFRGPRLHTCLYAYNP